MPPPKTTGTRSSAPVTQDPEQDERDRYGFIDRVRTGIQLRHRGPIGDYYNSGVHLRTGEFRDGYSPFEVKGPEGSARVWTQSANDHSHLVMEFTPAKYLWGHNLYGPSDMLAVVITIVPDVLQRLNLSLSGEEEELLFTGASRLYRVDSTAMQDLGSNEAVEAHRNMIATGRHCSLRRKTIDIGSVTFGRPDYYEVEVYNKQRELTDRSSGWGENYDAATRELVLRTAGGKERTEVQMGAKKLLREKLSTVADWNPLTPGRIVRANQRLIRVNEHQSLPPAILKGLPRATRSVYWMWHGGDDPKNHYSKSGLRTHRKALMALGIDITVPRIIGPDEKSPPEKLLTFTQIVELPYEQPPESFITNGLYYELSTSRG